MNSKDLKMSSRVSKVSTVAGSGCGRLNEPGTVFFSICDLLIKWWPMATSSQPKSNLKRNCTVRDICSSIFLHTVGQVNLECLFISYARVTLFVTKSLVYKLQAFWRIKITGSGKINLTYLCTWYHLFFLFCTFSNDKVKTSSQKLWNLGRSSTLSKASRVAQGVQYLKYF